MQLNRAVVRLDYIRKNAEIFAERARGARFCAVVKADAYGHGAAAVAQALEGVADFFAVAVAEEGARLRHAGVSRDILVLTPPLCEEEVLRSAALGLVMTVSDADDYALIARACEKYGAFARCHIKANTGMNRYGFDFEPFIRWLAGRMTDRISVEGVYSHFYRPEHAPTARAQFELFQKFAAAAERAFGTLTKHIAATGGVLASGEYRMDAVRVGLGLYGYVPEGFSAPEGLKSALKLYTTVSAARNYSFGGAGYGDYLPQGKALSVLRAGYADGFFRAASQGNRLCMDACVAEAERGKYEEVCVFSDADEYARRHGTISYEALVNICGRAVKEYVNG